jgi:hypothetical protein
MDAPSAGYWTNSANGTVLNVETEDGPVHAYVVDDRFTVLP